MGHELVRFDFPGWPDDADADLAGTWQTATRTSGCWKRFSGPAERRGSVFWLPVRLGGLPGDPRPDSPLRACRRSTSRATTCISSTWYATSRHTSICAWCRSRRRRPDFAAVGARPVRIQLAANPRVYHPLPEPRLYDVTFVGQRYADRADLLQHLYANGDRRARLGRRLAGAQASGPRQPEAAAGAGRGRTVRRGEPIARERFRRVVPWLHVSDRSAHPTTRSLHSFER